MTDAKPWRALLAPFLATGLLLSGCSDSDSDDSTDLQQSVNPAVAAEGDDLEADIRRTTNGVPHIKADTLEEATFGVGYAQASDNLCTLAEAIVRARSERARYFGPGENDANVISDFSLKALDVIGGAEEGFDNLSPESTAMIEGFTAGYNQYLEDTDVSDQPPQCQGQPWVRKISPVDLLAHYRVVAQLASGGQFATGAVFLATPPGESSDPENLSASVADEERQETIAANIHRYARTAAAKEDFVDTGVASNAWGIGGDMTEQGRGALLGNPHFPYTGPRRLYQMQLTVPGFLNVHGSGLLGTAVPLINFNENLAWSHTVSTSRRFTLYELNLGDDGNPLTYFKDGEKREIQEKTFQIKVNTGAPELATFERTFYFSEFGPMLSANAVTSGQLAEWGGEGTKYDNAAFTFRDANKDQNNLLDSWLGMSRASNLEEFKDVFRACGTTLWTNTVYADDQGNAYYIDSTSVPNLSKEALAVLNFKRGASDAFNALFNNGLTLLDGGTSRDDWVEGKCDGLVPFEDKPQLVRKDWVQNSNDTPWATNPEEPLTDFSVLYGVGEEEQSARTRLGLKMLQNPMSDGFVDGSDLTAKQPAGQDGKFSARDLIDTIHNNRSFWAEQFLPELRERCNMIGSTTVNVPDGDSRSVASGCNVLSAWDGYYDLDSVGAHVFRVFMTNYGREICAGPDFSCLADVPPDERPNAFTTPFDPEQPVATPADPSTIDKGTADDVMLQSLAQGLNALDAADVAVSAQLRDVQVYQPSGGVPPGGTPQELGTSFPWHGGHGEIDGAFNAVETRDMNVAQDTLFPIVNDPPLARAQGVDGLEKQGLPSQSGKWFKIRGTSFHFGLEFTENGPQAYGLTTYSQSTDPGSEFFNDQSERYSMKDERTFPFTEAEIEQNLLPNGQTVISSD